MNKISIRGVVIGGVTDIVATVILTLPLVVYVIAAELPGTFKGPLQVAIMATIRASPLLYGLQSIIGLACSVLGGYVAARVAKHDELLNGVLASSLPIALGVSSLTIDKDSGPLLLSLLLLIVSPLCSGLGGYLRLPQIRGTAQSQFQGTGRPKDDVVKRAKDALKEISDGLVDAKQIDSIRAALDLQATAGDHRQLEQRNVFGATVQVLLWKIVLSAVFWLIAVVVIAAVISHAGIDLFGVSRKLTGH